MKNKKRFLATAGFAAYTAAVVLSLVVCNMSGKRPVLYDARISANKEFGSVNIGGSIEDFNNAGFAYGDSVDLSFSNGRVIKDIPYYSGYYNQNGEDLVCAYPGYEHPVYTKNNVGKDWKHLGLTENDTVTVSLNKRGKYRSVEEALCMRYSDNRDDFDDDEEFANFRSLEGGSMKSGAVFRSASPCNNVHNRAAYADSFARNAGINFVLDLSDDEEMIENYFNAPDYTSSYFKKLYQEGKVAAIKLKSNFDGEGYSRKLAAGLLKMEHSEGPYLIHCVEGKDRTGFVAIVLEALCGADYEEIKDDYMMTYKNYYGISEFWNHEKYQTIVDVRLAELLEYIAGVGGDVNLEDIDWGRAAEVYLEKIGLSSADIALLKSRISCPTEGNQGSVY